MSLTNSQYDAIMREYSKKQLRSARLQKERKAFIGQKIPQLARLDEKAASLSVRCARTLLMDGADQTGLLRDQLEQISRERARLLAAHGYPADYLEPVFECPDCKDTGYQGQNRCHCFRQAVVDLFYTQSGLQKVLAEENFSTFRLDYYPTDVYHPVTGKSARENMQEIVRSCLTFLDTFDTKGGNLLFYGPTGLGKTFLSHCIAERLISTAHSVIYYSSEQLFHALEAQVFSRSQDPAPDTSAIYECDLLIIDDLGTEMVNSFVASQLFRLLNERGSASRSTLISTNLSLPLLSDTYSERIMSRITSSFTLLGFFGNDIRIEKKLGGAYAASK